jgi:predicted amidohydrolase
MTTFSIAGLQLALPDADNRAHIEREIASTMARFPWVQMVVLGELATYGFSLDRAEPLPGPTEQHYQALARRHGIWLVPGSLFERRDGVIHNTTPVIDPQGQRPWSSTCPAWAGSASRSATTAGSPKCRARWRGRAPRSSCTRR